MFDPFKELQKSLDQLVNKEIAKQQIIPIVKQNIQKLNIRIPLEVTIVESDSGYKVDINSTN